MRTRTHTRIETTRAAEAPREGRLAQITGRCGAVVLTAIAAMFVVALDGDVVLAGTATLWAITMALAATTYLWGVSVSGRGPLNARYDG